MQTVRIPQGESFTVPINAACTVFVGKSDSASISINDGDKVDLSPSDSHHFEATSDEMVIYSTKGSIGIVLQSISTEFELAVDTIEIPLDGTISNIAVVHQRGYIPQVMLIDSFGNTITFALTHNDNQSLAVSTVLPVVGTLIIY